ncbi:hypothetical protein DVH24_031718 [Malus domestica]|uniref:Uncharacterized protein n=1 Tax=Malus domestica TaxID=3750 RepID=A0A498J7H4_MALDO|nr:hypothetical protein DVH24_031718 [Malus domestica]
MVEFLSQDYAEGISVQARLDSIATLHNLSRCHQIIPSLVSSGVTVPIMVRETSSQGISLWGEYNGIETVPIMQEVDAEGEKVDGVSTTALRLVEEKLAKISSGR